MRRIVGGAIRRMTAGWGLRVACMASALAAAGCATDAAQAPATPDVALQVQRATYTATSDVKSPSWKLNVTIKNPGRAPIVLGETLLVIETIADSTAGAPFDDVTFHVRRLRGKDDNATSIADRYMTLFGYSVELDGTAIIPFGALSDLTGSKGSINLFIASMASPRIPALAGGGFGTVPASGQASFDAEVIAPVGPKKRLGMVVVLPSLTVTTTPGRSTRHVWYEFPVADANDGDRLANGVKHESPEGAPGLVALARNAQAPIWQRRLALNWLVEDFPKDAASVLGELLRSESQRSLFRAAIANAGMLKSREAAAPLAALLAGTSDRGLTLLSLEALGRIGDASVASTIRPLVDNKDAEIGRAAMLALGALHDAESTAHLLDVFSRSKDYRPAWAAAKAIIDIGDPAAVARLLGTLANPKAVEIQRRAVASALTATVAAANLSELAVVLTAKDIQYGLASDAAEAIGRVGTPVALDTLRGLVDTAKPETADLVIRAMTRNEDPVWRNAVIDVATSPTSKLRGKAIYYLGIFEVKAALPALREAAAGADPDIRKAACSALDSLKDPKPPSCGASKAP